MVQPTYEELLRLVREQRVTIARQAARIAEQDVIISDLRAENRRLEAENEAIRGMKGRSPAEWSFHVVSWEERPITFQPRGESQPKTVPGLRLHIRPDDASEGVPYWDITSKRLIAMLLPLLPGLAGSNRQLEVSKIGEGLSSSYSVIIHSA